MIICKIDECRRPIMYKTDQLCQMHYFRRMRNGSFDLKPKSEYIKYPGRHGERLINPAGYHLIYKPGHPLLKGKFPYIFEHRFIMYEKYGDTLPGCKLCGKEISWGTAHIDHIDEVVGNNNPENLRPVCNPCNTRRNYPETHTLKHTHAFTFEGETKTARAWGLDPRVNIYASTIIKRRKRGMSDADALFAPRKTRHAKIRELKKELGL